MRVPLLARWLAPARIKEFMADPHAVLPSLPWVVCPHLQKHKSQKVTERMQHMSAHYPRSCLFTSPAQVVLAKGIVEYQAPGSYS